jgi:Holliday junction resolvase RusA-like endonuclease
MGALGFDVFGRPAPQGSKRYIGGSAKQGGRFIEASKYLPAWRKAVMESALEAIDLQGWVKASGPVEVEVTFFLERPATVTQAKRPWPIKPPDLDKLVRSLDSLTDAGVWDDDGQMVKLIARKCYADTRAPGAHIKVSVLSDM